MRRNTMAACKDQLRHQPVAIIQAMHLPPQITRRSQAGHDCLQLKTRHGTATLALHGAHLLSWVPAGQRDVFWMSPQSAPEPAAIRGGVPVCWPWFAKQGMPADALQHGPVRNLPWQVSAVHASCDDEVSLSLMPREQVSLAPNLRVSLRITLGKTLQQVLHTRNLGSQPFQLTQALHSYFAVSDATQISIEGLNSLPYLDKLRGMTPAIQQAPFAFDQSCDRIYHHTALSATHRYGLTDPLWKRRILIDTQGSASVVIWNPGSQGAQAMPDVPDAGWQDFFCIEAANAGPNVINLLPGAEHQLAQTLSVI